MLNCDDHSKNMSTYCIFEGLSLCGVLTSARPNPQKEIFFSLSVGHNGQWWLKDVNEALFKNSRSRDIFHVFFACFTLSVFIVVVIERIVFGTNFATQTNYAIGWASAKILKGKISRTAETELRKRKRATFYLYSNVQICFKLGRAIHQYKYIHAYFSNILFRNL